LAIKVDLDSKSKQKVETLGVKY